MEAPISTVLIGLIATALTDIWGIIRHRLLRVPPPDYALVGRWIAHMRRGIFRHDDIRATAPVGHECTLGWIVHYLIGIAFAALLPAIWGESWLRHPTLVPPLGVGVATVAAPFLLMQPGMGLGIAASRTPRPGRARLHSLLTHAVFGLGLYLGARLLAHAAGSRAARTSAHGAGLGAPQRRGTGGPRPRPIRRSQSLSHSRLDPEVVPTQRPARRPLRA
jgi:hypothetical protein